MKNTIKTFGIIAIVAVIGFSLIACDEKDDNNPIAGRSEITFTNQQVFTYDIDEYEGTVNFSAIGNTVNLNFDDNYPYADASITAGRLNLTISTPDTNDLFEFDYIEEFLEDYDFTNIVVSDPAVKAAFVLDFYDYSNDTYHELRRGNFSINVSMNNTTFDITGSGSSESIMYLYVDREVRISATGWTDTYTGEYGTEAFTVQDVNLFLGEGWHPIRLTSAITVSGNIINEIFNETVTFSISAGNKTTDRWLLDAWGGDPSGLASNSINLPQFMHATPFTVQSFRIRD